MLRAYTQCCSTRRQFAIGQQVRRQQIDLRLAEALGDIDRLRILIDLARTAALHQPALIDDADARSEGRRVGKECVSKCRSRGAPDHYKKTTNETTDNTNS